MSLPDGDEGQRSAIVDLAARARTELAQTLGVPPPRVSLRFHPTVYSYERTTREPWFTSASIVNGEINLLPPSVLRDRGVLDRTIRHQLVRMMVDETLARRPLWVREGAALYFASAAAGGGKKAPAQAKAACPQDLELVNPVSAGALTTAYARAQACFERQVAQGRSWRDVR